MDMSCVTERGPKVRVIASDSTWIEGEALRQLEEVAALPGMRQCVGMPDLHPAKAGPNGAAFLAESVLYPNLVGTDGGCGIGLWQTDLPLKKARPERLAERMNGLDTPWDGDIPNWLSCHGVEPTAYDASCGTPGFGNHFIEVQAVHQVKDSAAFAALGLDDDRLLVLVHSGSRGFGEAVLRDVVAKHGAVGLPSDGPDARAFLAAHDHALRWAVANRALCAHRALEVIGGDATRVLDVCHNSVTSSFVGGCQCWLHRKGAAPADCGPVVIPGSRGDLSALVRPVPGRMDALQSLAHGAGRKLARHEARGKLRGLYRKENLLLNRFGGRVVCGNELLAWEEAPECYKPLASVVGDLEAAGLVETIALLRPLVTFKTSERVAEKGRGRAEWKDARREARDAKREREWA